MKVMMVVLEDGEKLMVDGSNLFSIIKDKPVETIVFGEIETETGAAGGSQPIWEKQFNSVTVMPR